jgi:hypothetical protein
MGTWRKKILRFGVPVFWREPVNQENDCYLCMTRTLGINSKHKHNILYPDVLSVTKSILHSEILPHPMSLKKKNVLELRPTTFGTPPLSKGWGRPEAEINPQKTDRLKTRDKTRLYTNTFLYFTLFNKLLVLPNIRLSILVLRHKRTLVHSSRTDTSK